MSKRTCSVNKCTRAHEGHGYCHSHLAAYKRTGEPPTRAFPETRLERLMAKIRVDGAHWIWTGSTASDGRYGAFFMGDRVIPAHRASWILHGRKVAADEVLDHICRITLCVNPDHLRPLTQRENILAGVAPAALNARKTHCYRGHEFTAENTRITPAGRRVCRSCARMRKKSTSA